MDKRQQKTRTRLFATILELASEHPLADLSMSQIAETAGVHRSTMYEHASSPTDLLQTALRAELDLLRHEYLDEVTDAATAVSAVTRAVLQHIDDHSAIYVRGLGSGSESASLHSMLAGHFQESTRLLLEQHVLEVPFAVASVSSETAALAAAHYVANGTVGAIEVWLGTPQPRDPDAFLAVIGHLVPSWWPTSGNAAVS